MIVDPMALAGELPAPARPAFVPDRLSGDDPAAVRAGSLRALARLLDKESFDGLPPAHGPRAVRGGRAPLEPFLRSA